MPKSAGQENAPAGKSGSPHAARATPAIAAPLAEVTCAGKTKDTGFSGIESILVTESSVNVSGVVQIPGGDAPALGAVLGEPDERVVTDGLVTEDVDAPHPATRTTADSTTNAETAAPRPMTSHLPIFLFSSTKKGGSGSSTPGADFPDRLAVTGSGSV